ncbi:3-oxoacyl-ACP synthase [Fibrella aestuarina]|nr:3-oxoacyl-ACP synthase [Fibrella aestuarina]
MNPLKQALYAACMAYVQQRIDNAAEAMRAAQEAANSEEKSSAGDKYETGRAMAQLERDRHAQLLAQAQQMKQELELLDYKTASDVARAGSVVNTSQGTFFLSISAGRLTVDGASYMAVSIASPIGALLRGHRAGDEVRFNQTTYRIEGVL